MIHEYVGAEQSILDFAFENDALMMVYVWECHSTV